MAKMLRICFLFLLFLSQCFGAFETQLAKFDKEFQNAPTELKIKFHHHLKNLYIQSIIDDDKKSKNEVLKRLIVSSKALNLDSMPYINELKSAGVDTSQFEKIQNSKKSEATQEHSTFNTQEKQTILPKETLEQRLFILKSLAFKNGIELILSKNLTLKDLKNLVLKEKDKFRYIIDFDAVLEGPRKTYEFENDVKITLSQYNPQTARIVLNSKDELECAVGFENLRMRFAFKKDDKVKINQEQNTTSVKQTAEKVVNEKKVQNLTKETSVKKAQEPKVEKKKNETKITEVKKEKANEKSVSKIENSKSQEDKDFQILKVEQEQNSIILRLNKELDKEDISYFVLKDKNTFRQVWDIKAKLLGKRRNFSVNKGSFSVSQFNPSTVRIVFSSNSKQKPSEKIEDENLEFIFASEKVNTDTINKAFRSRKIIVIDAGHGGKDSGALGNRLKEKDIVLNLALRLGNDLKERGYKVFYTRSKDQFINLRARTKFANDKNADLFISIHANAVPKEKASSTQGFETFFLSPARSERSKKAAELENQSDVEEMNYFSKQTFLNFLNREKIIASNKLAIDIQKAALKSIRTKYKVNDGGVREAPFWVLVGAQMPAVLVEIGYITHPSEGKRIANKNFQDSLAQGVADGIDNYFYNNR